MSSSRTSLIADNSNSSVHPMLPKGAMPPMNQLKVDSPPASPPATPSRPLLEDPAAHVQFASYPEKPKSWRAQSSPTVPADKQAWVPAPLKPWFWIPFVVILVLAAVGLEVAFHFSQKNQGWPTKSDFTQVSNVLHYLYTLPPVIIVAIFVALWTWTDIEIKKMQPYVDLVAGDSTPKRSLLLDYTRNSNVFVWIRAASNRHYLVVMTTLMVLLSLSFQPLASSLLQVRNTWLPMPDMTLNNLAAIGLNQDTEFNDLTSFLTAAGYASASVLYSLPDAPFVNGPYTVAPFELPTGIENVNSTVLTTNTSAIKNDPGCRPVQVQSTQNTTDGTWSNSATLDNCSITWIVDRNATSLFGADVLQCSPSPPIQFSPVVFWFFTYPPAGGIESSATFCFPTISLWEVTVSLDLASGNLTSVTEIGPFNANSPFSQFSSNVTGDPLDGRAYNGIAFNLTNPDRFVLARQNATDLQLPAAVFQAAEQSSFGLLGAFINNQFVTLTNQVYTNYMALIARRAYFLSTNQPNTVQVRAVQQRVFLSPLATHLLAVGMLLLAIGATITKLVHRVHRRSLRLRHEPGTIASAVSIGGQTGFGELLSNHQSSKEMYQVLQGKKFRIDPETMKIIMEDEDGHGEWANSPTRKSVFAALQQSIAGNRFSKRFSRGSYFPSSPKSPRSPVPEAGTSSN